MSKKNKIKITIEKDRPNLYEDFSSWLKNNEKTRTSYRFYSEMDIFPDDWDEYMEDYGCFYGYDSHSDFWDDDDEYEDWDISETFEDYKKRKAKEEKKKNKKENKRGGRGKKRSSKNKGTIDYSEEIMTDAELDGILGEKKEIYFYDDIEDQSTVHKFNNLRKFFLFLDEKGYEMSDTEGSKFIRETVRHCCLDPMQKEVHNKDVIISDHSYGALSYEVSEDASLFRDY